MRELTNSRVKLTDHATGEKIYCWVHQHDDWVLTVRLDSPNISWQGREFDIEVSGPDMTLSAPSKVISLEGVLLKLRCTTYWDLLPKQEDQRKQVPGLAVTFPELEAGQAMPVLDVSVHGFAAILPIELPTGKVYKAIFKWQGMMFEMEVSLLYARSCSHTHFGKQNGFKIENWIVGNPALWESEVLGFNTENAA